MHAPTGTSPTHSNYKEAAAVCIFYGDTVCLARRRMACPLSGQPIEFPGYWAPFGGAIDPHENPMTAACRELKEEAQIELDISDLKYMESITNDDGSTYTLYAYHTDSILFPLLNFEHTEYGYFLLDGLSTAVSPLCPQVENAILSYEARRWKG